MCTETGLSFFVYSFLSELDCLTEIVCFFTSGQLIALEQEQPACSLVPSLRQDAHPHGVVAEGEVAHHAS